MSFIIRQAVNEDAVPIAQVHIASWRGAYKGIVDQGYLDNGLDLQASVDNWKLRLKVNAKHIFVALDKGTIIGFAALGQSRNETLPNHAELYSIYLRPDYFKQGAGKALLNAAFNDAIDFGFTHMFVSVLKDSLQGRRFYERTGAQLISHSEDTFDIGGSAYKTVCYEWEL